MEEAQGPAKKQLNPGETDASDQLWGEIINPSGGGKMGSIKGQ